MSGSILPQPAPRAFTPDLAFRCSRDDSQTFRRSFSRRLTHLTEVHEARAGQADFVVWPSVRDYLKAGLSTHGLANFEQSCTM